jgi:hypothetical protein
MSVSGPRSCETVRVVNVEYKSGNPEIPRYAAFLALASGCPAITFQGREVPGEPGTYRAKSFWGSEKGAPDKHQAGPEAFVEGCKKMGLCAWVEELEVCIESGYVRVLQRE